MPWNGTGSFTRVYSWEADALAGIKIIATRMDTDTNDITNNGFGNTLTRDGQGSAVDDLPMNNFRHTGVGDADARDEYGVVHQIQENAYTFAIAGGTGDAVTAAFTPTITALVDGMRVTCRATAANTITTPTFKADGTTAHRITKLGNQPLSIGDISTDLDMQLEYNLANLRWELLNPRSTTGIAQLPWSVATGAPNVITAAYTPAISALTDGLLLGFRAAAANTTTTPTFSPDGLTAHTIVKNGGSALVAGDIPNALAECLVQYDLTNTRWELLNPANPKVAPTVLVSGNLSTGTATAIILDLSSYGAYNRLELSIDNLIPSSSAVGVVAQYSTDGGSTFITTSTYSTSQVDFISTYTQTELASTSNISMGLALISAAKWSFICNLFGINLAQSATMLIDAVYYNGSVTHKQSSTGTNSNNSITGIKVLVTSGIVTAGTYRLVGYP